MSDIDSASSFVKLIHSVFKQQHKHVYGRLYKDKRCERDLIEVQCHLMICTTTSSSLRLIGWLKLTVIFAFWNKCLTLFIIISRKIIHIEGHRNRISSTNSFCIEAMRKDLFPYLFHGKAIKFYGRSTDSH